MITAVYVNSALTSEQQALVRRAVEGTDVISNAQLPVPHTLYALGERKASVYGQATKYISRKQYPFDWMHPMASRLALMVALAKDSDRILLMFGKTAEVPDLFVLMAQAHSHTIRIFRGTESYTPGTLDKAEQQYKTIIMEPVKPLPEPEVLFQTPNGSTVRPYQQQMIDFAKDRPGTGWFVDMGLGKTMAALVLLDYWMKNNDLNPERPICIVAPIMVALDTWARECDKWGYDWDIKRNIRLTPKKRENLLQTLILPQEKPTLFLTNPDQLKPVREYFFSRNMPLPFESLIIDELSLFKSPTAKRNTEITYYRRIAKRFLGLTGTPASNHLIDVWNQLKLVSTEETQWAGRTIYDFQDKFFVPGKKTIQGFVTRWDPKAGAEEAIFRNAAKSAVSMRTEGLVQLPDISFSNMYVTLPENAREEYNKLENEIAEEMGDSGSATYQIPGGPSILLPNSDVLSGKLLQLAGGALYTDSHTHTYEVLHDEKITALDNLIEAATSPLLVFYYFASDLDRIQKKYKNNIPVLDSKDKNATNMVTMWNKGEIPVMLAHPASVGHGLNLQEGPGHTAVWFSFPNWDNDKYQQANKRLYRSGQQNAVSVIHIVAKDTIEEVMLQSLKSKERTNDALMKALDRTNRLGAEEGGGEDE